MTPPASSTARSGCKTGRLWLKVLAGWILLSIACSLPANPLTAHNPFTASTNIDPTPTATLATLPTPIPQVPPTLVEVSPNPGSQADKDTGITFYFNQAMDRASVEDALQIVPPLTGVFDWQDDATLRFIPKTAPELSSFNIRFGPPARAQNGLELVAQPEMTFNSAGILQLVEGLPAANAQNVDPSAAVVAVFNLPVVPLSAEDRFSPPGFTLEPSAPGRGEWINTSTYIFYPEPALAGGIEYTVTLASDLTAASGARLPAEQYSWRFTTANPRLIALQPEERTNVFLDTAFELTFNQPMDPASVEENFQLRAPTGENIPGTFEWHDDNSRLVFTPASRLNRGSAYNLSLAAMVQSLGGTPLGSPVSVDYTTVSALALTGRTPSAGEQLQLRMGYGFIALQFNAPLTAAGLKDAIQIDPPLSQPYINLAPDQKSITISGYFEASTAYTLTVSRALRDRWNQPLRESIEIVTVTSPAQPGLSAPMLQVGGSTLFMLPGDTQLLAEATNLSMLDITASTLGLPEFLTLLESGQFDILPEAGPQETWQQPLELSANRSQSIEVPLAADGSSRAPGLYHFSIRYPEMSRNTEDQPLEFTAVVSQIQLAVKRSQSEVFVWALDLESNRPVEGAEVTLLDQSGKEIGRLVTAADGTGHSAVSTSESYEPIFAVSGTPGEPDFSLATDRWGTGLNGWNFGLYSRLGDYSRFGYAYTDRPIYMPGQTVHFRATLHQQRNGRYSPPDLDQVSVKIWGEYSILDGQQPLVAEMELNISEFGSVTGALSLPETASPGTYTLRVDEFPTIYLPFQVAEYRKPEIDLQVHFAADSLLRGDEIEALVHARYYFGDAAGDLPVRWTLSAADDPVYLSGGYQSGALNLEMMYAWYEDFGYSSIGDDGVTAEDGSLVIEVSASELENLLQTGNRRRLTLEVTTLSETEAPVSARASTVLNPAEFTIGVRPERYSAEAGTEFGFSILTVDLEGDPSGDHVLQARFQKVIWPEPEEYVAFAPPPAPTLTLVSSTDFQTGADGQARLAFTPPDPGTYQLEIAGEDALTQVLVWVGGAGAPNWPKLPDQHIPLQADQTEYRPGESAQIFVPNPFGAGAQALVTIERGRVMRSEVMTADGPALELNIPIISEDAPNVYLSVILTGQTSGGQPDFRTGYLELVVTPEEQILQVDLVGSPAKSTPGGEVTFTLQVSNFQGEPVQGEFSLALVDKAVLALAEPNAERIAEAYYGQQPLGVSTSMSLAAYNRRINLSPEAGGRGGGPSQLSPDVRTRFEDTAFWNGAVLTGPDGRVEVSVTLPDNLTTWVALVRGLDQDARVGEATMEVVATKDLLVRPQAPRFLVEGDHVVLGAVIHNNTTSRLVVEARLEASGFELDNPDRAVQQMEIPAGGQTYVTWDGSALPVDAIDLIFSAQAGELSDAATPAGGALPVLKYHAPQTYGTAGMLSDAGERLEVVALPRTFTPTGGSLRVELSPSLASAVLDELKIQHRYPTDFTEAILSSFLPNLQALQALRGLGYASPELEAELEREITDGITALQRMQNEDGGWGMTASAHSDPHISAYVLFGLAHAQTAGQLVDSDVLEGGRTYLLMNLSVPDAGTEPAELDRLAFQNFALQQAGAQDPALQRLYDFREDMNPWAQGLLALTLSGNDPQDARGREILMALKDAVRRSSTGVHWQERHPSPRTFSSANYNTAVVIYTLAKLDPASPILPDAVRYLLSARRAGGGWASSYESAWSLLALTQALQGTADVQANYAYRATLDGAELTAGQAATGSLEPVTVEVSLDRLRSGTGSELRIRRESGSGRLYYRSFLELYRPVESAAPISKGLHVERRYYLDGQDCRVETCITQDTFNMTPGSQVLVRLTLTLPESMNYLVVEDFIPAGAEIIDTRLKTVQVDTPDQAHNRLAPFDAGWNGWIFGVPRIYSDHIWWVAQEVPAGTYELTYRLQPLHKGEFRVLPAHVYQYYFPDVEGTSGGGVVTFR
jgi:alpha-2-macroglobulin